MKLTTIIFSVFSLGIALAADQAAKAPDPGTASRLASAKPATPAEIKAPALSEERRLELQILGLQSSLDKANSEVASLKNELDLLRYQLSERAAAQTQSQQTDLAKRTCREASVPEVACGNWLTEQVQNAAKPQTAGHPLGK